MVDAVRLDARLYGQYDIEVTNEFDGPVQIFVEPGALGGRGITQFELIVDPGDTLYLYGIGGGEFGSSVSYVERLGEDFTYVYVSYTTTGGSEVNGARIFVEGAPTIEANNLCFTRGAQVLTPEGSLPIETLRVGDLVVTRDHGPKPIRWIGSTTLSAETLAQFPEKRPVTMAAGALGDHGETTVSPAHRVLLEGWRAEALFGEGEVLSSAVSLVNDTTIRRADFEEVEYIHILFDTHEIICADGLWSESFDPGAVRTGLEAATRDEVVELFPEIEGGATPPAARRTVEPADVAVLF